LNPVNKFIEHLIKQEFFPFEKIIADGEPHQLTDVHTGRQYKYIIYPNNFRLIEITCRAA